MTGNGSGQIREDVDLLLLAGARDRQQASDGEFTVGTASPEHDLPPLNGGPQRPFGDIVGRLDAVRVHEGEEVRVMEEQRPREIRHVGVRGVDVASRQGEEPLLDGEHLRDQLRAGEGRPAYVWIPPEAAPVPKELPLQREGLPAEPFRRGGLRQVLRAQQIASEVRPAKLSACRRVLQVAGQPVAAQNAGEGGAPSSRRNTSDPREVVIV